MTIRRPGLLVHHSSLRFQYFTRVSVLCANSLCRRHFTSASVSFIALGAICRRYKYDGIARGDVRSPVVCNGNTTMTRGPWLRVFGVSREAAWGGRRGMAVGAPGAEFIDGIGQDRRNITTHDTA